MKIGLDRLLSLTLVFSFLVLAVGIQGLAAPGETSATLTGVVYRDLNANGQRDTATGDINTTPQFPEPGVAGVTVTAYPASASGTSNGVSTVTANDGTFTLNVPSAGTWRLEVTDLPSYLFDGAAGSTTVVFANTGTSNLEIGVNNPAQYSQPDPVVATVFMSQGAYDGDYADNPGLISMRRSGVGANAHNGTVTGSPTDGSYTQLSTFGQIGAAYGMAWDRTHGYLYTAAFHKYLVGYGPGGRGQIYRTPIDPKTGQATAAPQQWVNVESDLGFTLCGDHGRDIDTPYPTGYEQTYFDQVGRCGMGDIDISWDDSILYVVLIDDHKVIGINTSTGTLAGQWAIPDPTDANRCTGTIYPFGMATKDDKVYVGQTCDNEAMVYVQQLIPSSGTWTTVMAFNPTQDPNGNEAVDPSGMNPWITDIGQAALQNDYRVARQLMVGDLAFYGEDITLGIRDRMGDQWGNQTPDPNGDSDGDGLTNTQPFGNLWCAYYDAGSGNYVYPLREGGSDKNVPQTCGAQRVTTSPNPSPEWFGGEFYWGDGTNNYYGVTVHTEPASGALAQWLLEDVVVTAKTPQNSIGFDKMDVGGIYWQNNVDGAPTHVFQIYQDDPGQFGKANGLGDLEALSYPAPLEIGNRLWCDIGAGGVGAENGVQDPGEPVVSGATVTLECDTDGNPGNGYEATATTTTDANGQYLFKDNTGNINAANGWPAAAWDSSIHIIPRNAQCRIKIDPTQSAITNSCGAGVNGPTVADNGGSDPGADKRDSDGVANVDGAGNIGVVFTTGGDGQNNHDLDFGFKQLQTGSLGDFVWNDTDADGVQDAGETGIQNVTVELYTNSSCSGTAAQSTTTNSSGNYSFTNLVAGTYSVKFIKPSGYTFSPANQGTDTTDSDADPSTGCTGAINLSAGENNTTWDAGLYHNKDWGDLPDSFDTTNAQGGPNHTITSNLYLGSCVDGEGDGQVDTTGHAGAAGGGSGKGDDGNTGTAVGTCSNNDDEDGVELVTPLIPDGQACFRVTAHNGLSSAATLMAWVDWNGDGDFDNGSGGVDQDESFALTTVTANTDLNNEIICTVVPSHATFDGGEVHMRFRLTTDTLTGTQWGGAASNGEVEDYWQPLACVGNYVWNDFPGTTANVQDASDTALSGVGVRLVWAGSNGNIETSASQGLAQGDDKVYTYVTGSDGKYQFCGLIPGTYRVQIPTPPSSAPLAVTPNQGGGDVKDSDGTQTGGSGTPVEGPDFTITDVTALPTGENGNGDSNGAAGPNNFPDNQVDETFDFGFRPLIDLSLTKDINDTTPHVGDVITFTITVTNSGPNDATGVQVTDQLPSGYSYVSDDGSGAFNSTTGVWTIGNLADGASVTLHLRAEVLASGNYTNWAEVTEADQQDVDSDPAADHTVDDLNDGLPDDDEDSAEPNTVIQANGRIGDLVWWDIDRDGVQDAGEPGIPNVALSLSGTASDSTTTDASGVYTFANLAAGTYTVTVDASNFTSGPLQNWTASPQNVGDDTKDSDGDPTDHNVSLTLGTNETNPTIDFGFTITTSYTLTKHLNTPDPVRVGAPISFTIRITNTGQTWLATLPLEDTYNTGYLTYGNNGQYAQPDSDDHNNDGTITWTDVLGGNPLAPGLSRTVVITFTGKADTTQLPGGKTTNMARAHDGTADPDGPSGPLGALESLPDKTDSDRVGIQSPTGIEFTSFQARGGEGIVEITWRTMNETWIAGFRLWRAALIPGAASEPVPIGFVSARRAGMPKGSLYHQWDGMVRDHGQYRYWLEVVYVNGTTYRLGPKSVWVSDAAWPMFR